MVIYNNKELASGLAIESRIVVVNSPLPIADLIEKLRSGEQISSEDAYIESHAFVPARAFTPLVPGIPETSSITHSYAKMFTKDDCSRISDALAIYKRPDEFAQFEAAQFNLPHELEFKDDEISAEELKKELMLAAGVLPTLLDSDAPLSELLELSKAGLHLIRRVPSDMEGLAPYGVISKDNPCPTAEAIKTYASMNPYEKRVIDEGVIHPRKLRDIAFLIKAQSKEALLTKDVSFYITAHTSGDASTKAPDVAAVFTEKYKADHAEALEKIENAFKEAFHGHAPRVLSEYVEGKCLALRKDPEFLTDEEIAAMVSSFNQKAVSVVAKYRSPVLLSMDGLLDFGSVPQALLQLVGVEMPKASLPAFHLKGFPQWLSAHKDVNPTELTKLLTYESRLASFDIDKTAKELIATVENARGIRAAQSFKEKSVYAAANYDFKNNEIAIRGRHIVVKQGNYTMRMLPADDYANFTIGTDTHCCQEFGNAGESCVYKYTSDPFAAGVVIEKNGRVQAQGFVWTDEALDTFVFDNVEFANDGDVSKFKDLFAAYAQALPYKNVHVGTGYNQSMNGWGTRIQYEAKLPTTIDNRTNITNWGNGNCYSDYHFSGNSIARALKSDGILQRGVSISSPVSVTTAPDEPTKWDELAKPDLAFMLNDASHTPEERIAIAKSFRDNPSEELQMDVITRFPAAIASLEHPCESVQRLILDHHPELVSKIKNPIIDVQVYLVGADPNYLRNMENPPEDLVVGALEKNGLMLEFINNPTENMVNTALRQNGYAWRFVPEEFQTTQAAVIASTTTPKAAASLIRDIPEEAQVTIARVDPRALPLIENPCEEAQVEAVKRQPFLINVFKEPAPSAVREAVSRNGLLIRNFQGLYPELREVALRQNGFAIGCLKNITPEEVRVAVLQNSASMTAIKDEELRNGLIILAQSDAAEPEFV